MLLGSLVPRFYGLTVDEIFAMETTEDDARLVIARGNGFVDWNELQAKAAEPDERQWQGPNTPLRRMSEAIKTGNLAELKSLVAEYPPLLRLGNPPSTHIGHGIATQHFMNSSATSRAIVAWAGSIGIDLQATLNYRLIGRTGWRMETEAVDRLIAEGGDPTWVAPNGYSVLEHAIYNYWDGEAVEALARHVKPRNRFWVAAGVGDVAMLRGHFGREGKLTAAAREDRPDMLALTSHGTPPMPGADENLILWDAAFAAALNVRGETLDFLLERGFPIDYHNGMTLLSFAVGNGLDKMAELLISRGASPHVRGWRPAMTAVESATDHYGSNPEWAEMRRILELLGLDPDQILREADAKRKPPQPAKHLVQIHGQARADAMHLGHKEIGIESMFVAMLGGEDELMNMMSEAGVHLDRLRERYAERLTVSSSAEEPLPNSAQLESVIHAAAAESARNRSEIVTTYQVLSHILKIDGGPIVEALRAAGGDLAKVREVFDRIGRPVNPPPRR
jgi:hypothetical protein